MNSQPGWLIEANGVLHPRGAEYGVQYVFDGLPVLDNRSPNFAPSPDVNEVQSMVIRTGGYPAEYGRKLGGVIEVLDVSMGADLWKHGKAVPPRSSGHLEPDEPSQRHQFCGTVLGNRHRSPALGFRKNLIPVLRP